MKLEEVTSIQWCATHHDTREHPEVLANFDLLPEDECASRDDSLPCVWVSLWAEVPS